jgi:hypothetical protein
MYPRPYHNSELIVPPGIVDVAMEFPIATESLYQKAVMLEPPRLSSGAVRAIFNSGEIIAVVAHPSKEVVRNPTRKDKSFFAGDKFPVDIDAKRAPHEPLVSWPR